MELTIKNLSKRYGTVQALDGVSVTLGNGIHGLLGPNGAGKSTLINLLTDNVRRESGEILWDGKEIKSLGSAYREVLGYMPQQQGYYSDFTAAAFLIYMGRLKGMGRKRAAERADEMLEIVNLTDVRRERIGGFSGGMMQRLLLAQSLMNDPKLLILDEPTAGVDPQERIRIRNFISEIAADRIVLLATHIVSDVEAIAGEIILMKSGKIIKKGSPNSLIEEVRGHVFEATVPQGRIPEIQRSCTVGNIRSTPDGLAVKIIADQPPEDLGAVPATANLEDVYLYYFEE